MKTIVPPILPPSLQAVTLSAIDPGQRFENVHIKEAIICNVDAQGIVVESAILKDTEISTSKLKKANISDSVFENCLLFGTNLDGSGLLRVQFKQGMYSGIVASDAAIEDVAFEEAKLNLANFRVSKFKRVIFKDCDLAEADFQGAEFKSVEFKNCDLSQAEFSNCTMRDVDLRGSNISTIKGISGLKGAKIDTTQLVTISPTMASELGLVVE